MNNQAFDTFENDGYLVVRNFLPAKTAERLKSLAVNDDVVSQRAFQRTDSAGNSSKLTLWYEPGDDPFGRLSRSKRMHDEMSFLLGGKAEFFHAKIMQKEARSGGAWEWHQDYGYWYDDGFLSDAMASCYVALDPAFRENGCLMVMPGTHKYGRMRHERIGQQIGAETRRVEWLKDRHPPVYVELEAGDAVYFHSSLLHASKPNASKHPRWGFISSFYRSDNCSISDDPRFQFKRYEPVDHDLIFSGSRALSSDQNFL